MSEPDLLLGDTVGTIVATGVDALIELVADGVMWRGAPIAGAAWARGLPRPLGGRTDLRERLAVAGYLHLERASYRVGERWVPAGAVRLRLESVSAWWLRGVAGLAAAPEGPSAPAARADTAPEPTVAEVAS
ncbi:hypothetical protein [Streptacidiphilus anmyonensis]|uniref:hypothetical protein n=1 Tax=Streptacidiphilus anmyonensis TaxID=405782 RepID=UPI0005A5DC26|nr:hypothetical protein [Streptacidiphilus anmyonensis]